MEQINIQTSTNVNIEYQPASIGERLLSHILDYLFLGGAYYILYLIFHSSGAPDYFNYIILVIPLFYDLIMEQFFQGKSLGKLITNIRVMGSNGEVPSFSSYFIRWAFRLIENVVLFGIPSILTIIIDGKGRRLGDLVANTIVLRDIKIKPQFSYEFHKDYVVTYPQASKLSDKDIEIIKEVYDKWNESSQNSISWKAMHKAKEVVCKKLNIQTNTYSDVFIRTIIKDFYFLNKIDEE